LFAYKKENILGKVITIHQAPAPKGCHANPPCVGPGLATDCAWEPPQVYDGVTETFSGVTYTCKRIPTAQLVTLADGTPALTHGNGKVRPFRPEAVSEIVARAKHNNEVDLTALQPLFDQVNRARNSL
jgi:hypothetical protein